MSSSAAAADSLSRIPSLDPRVVPVVWRDEASRALASDRLQPDWLRRRFALGADWSPEMTGDRFRQRPEPPRPAAVLVPLVTHTGGLSMLLTERTAQLRTHSGQVAFPGGRCDPDDRSVVHTALREAREEVGLVEDHIEVLGTLPEYLTGTGYRVTPVVALVRPGFELAPHDFEVASTFEVPLSFLMNPANHERRHVVDGAIDRQFYAMPWRAAPEEREFFIWGATAAMIRNLYHFLRA